MTTRDALIAACRANRADDLPRLVFADFLDESGCERDAARARRIRTMIAMRAGSCDLFADMTWTWDRGFVVGVECAADWWLRHGDDLVREHDVQTVRLTTWPRVRVTRESWPTQHVTLADYDSTRRVSVVVTRDDLNSEHVSVAVCERLLRAHWPSVVEWSLPIGRNVNFRRNERGDGVGDGAEWVLYP